MSEGAGIKYQLRTFGGLEIEDEAGKPVAPPGRRHALALLALLAGSNQDGLSRDRLIAYLWPESDDARGRNSLKQAAFALRKVLGPDIIANGAASLRLNPDVISVDTWAFAEAVARSEFPKAADLYRGPFLDGFYLAGSASFEHWVEEERERLASQHRALLEKLAVRATKANRPRESARWWRRLAHAEPLDARYATELVKALDAAGDRAGAEAHSRLYAGLVREELGADPDPAVKEVLAAPPRKTEELPPISDSHPIDVLSVPPTQEFQVPAHTQQLPVPAAETPPPAPPVFLDRWARAGLAAVVVLLVAVLVLAIRRPEEAPAAGSPIKVAVLPFRISGGPEARYLSTGLMDLVAASLDHAADLRAVDPSAMAREIAEAARSSTPIDPAAGSATAYRFGARLFVLGEAIATGSRLRVSASIYDRSTAPVLIGRASVEGTTDQLFELTDQLSEQLIARRYRGPAERLSGVAASTTRSLPALKAYLAGEDFLREDRHGEAMEAYQQAIEADTTFALAYYRLSVAADRAGLDQLAWSAADRAARSAHNLSERDRRLVEAYLALKAGDLEQAEASYRGVLAAFPGDIEGWFGLAELLFHSNPVRGRSVTEAEPALQQVLQLDPEHVEALVHLARIESLLGRRRETEGLVARALALVSDSSALELRALRSFVVSDSPNRRQMIRWLQSHPGSVRAVTALQAAVDLDDLDGTERFARDLSSVQVPDVRGFGHRLSASVALSRGQVQAARRHLTSAAEMDSTAALELSASFATLPFVVTPRAELLDLKGALQRSLPSEGSRLGPDQAGRLHALGLVAAALGEIDLANRSAEALERLDGNEPSPRYGRTLARSVRARVALAVGRGADALRLLEGAGWPGSWQQFAAEAGDRYLRAHLLQRLGRLDEALSWYRSIAERASYELVFLAPAELHQAEIYRQRGDTALAASHFRRFASLWGQADPELRAAVSKGETRLASVSH
jgi:DNA-binding SARP family transcriptional activator/TolB-like protein